MRILYILLLAGAAVFYLLYSDNLSFLTLIMLIIFPAILFILLLIASTGISAEFEDKHIIAEKGKPFSITVKIRNKTFLPVSNLKMYVRYSNRFDGKIRKHTINIPAALKSCETVVFNMSYAHCGTVDIVIKKMVIFDLIKLFRVPKRILKTAYVTVLPEVVPVMAEVTSCADTDMDSDTFYSDKSGDDPSEVFDLREYHDSDNLNRVHWKLSSRNEEMIIREFSKPYTSTILILPEISDCRSENETDAVLGIMNSIAVYLVEQGVKFTVGRILFEDGSAVFEKIKSSEELLYFCCSVLENMHIDCMAKLADNVVNSENTLKIYSHIIYISPDCNIDSLSSVKNISSARLTYIQPVSDKKPTENAFSEVDEYIPVSLSDISGGLTNINL
jgi:uncharacterized protein (DUF58 family)